MKPAMYCHHHKQYPQVAASYSGTNIPNNFKNTLSCQLVILESDPNNDFLILYSHHKLIRLNASAFCRRMAYLIAVYLYAVAANISLFLYFNCINSFQQHTVWLCPNLTTFTSPCWTFQRRMLIFMVLTWTPTCLALKVYTIQPCSTYSYYFIWAVIFTFVRPLFEVNNDWVLPKPDIHLQVRINEFGLLSHIHSSSVILCKSKPILFTMDSMTLTMCHEWLSTIPTAGKFNKYEG